jgi:glycerol-3-phosphate dehydrogenase
MKRDLEAMAAKTYDLVVVGGGITGACIARDAALRGMSVALVEKGDFASATTAASSKLIHGGLRYLQHLGLRRVRECLRERRAWSTVAPHMVEPVTFLMPTTGERIRDRVLRAIGMTLYDWLSYDRNRLEDPEMAIPTHKMLSRGEAVALEPSLASDDLTGAMVFYDYVMHSPERLALECVLSAAAEGADVANYAEVAEFLTEEDRVCGVRVRDVRPDDGNGEYAIRGRVVVNATGPWTDRLTAALSGTPHGRKHGTSPARRITHSKGIHLVTRALTIEHGIAVQGDRMRFFILPWRGHSILGTMDRVFEGDPADVHVSEKDIVDFLAQVNGRFPGVSLRRSDILFFYAGLRPVVDTADPAASLPIAADAMPSPVEQEEPDARLEEVIDHEAEEGVGGMITAIGGKWTTSRHLAEQVVDLATVKLGMAKAACATGETPTFGGDVGPFREFVRRMTAKYSEFSPDLVEHLAKNYGNRIDDVVALARENPRLKERLSERFPDIAAEVAYAVRNEMALTVEDVLFRRTGLGTLGSPGGDAVARVGDVMGAELAWDEGERTAQIDRAVARFTSWARTRAIVNPSSWGNRTGTVWPVIQKKLSHAIGPVEAVFTDSPMAAQRLCSEALKEGMEQVIAVGGDGTVNEVVNGFYEDGKPINPEALLGLLTSGTGGDYRRTFGLPLDLDEQIERLAVSEIRCVDLGKLTYTDENGREATRLFDNVGSFGLSGATDMEVNRLTWGKKFGGTFAFQWGVVKALIRHRNQPVRVQVDDIYDEVRNVTVVAVCNGQFFGGGMRIGPDAEPDDGLFDIVIVADLSLLDFVRNIGSLYRGAHVNNPRVTVLRGRRVTATPAEGAGEVLLDVDGETPGCLPATFEILPNALYLRS